MCASCSASHPTAFDIEICVRDVSQSDTLALRLLVQPTPVHGGLNVPIPPEVFRAPFRDNLLSVCAADNSGLPHNIARLYRTSYPPTTSQCLVVLTHCHLFCTVMKSRLSMCHPRWHWLWATTHLHCLMRRNCSRTSKVSDYHEQKRIFAALLSHRMVMYISSGARSEGYDFEEAETDLELSDIELLRSPVNRVLQSAKLHQPWLAGVCEVRIPWLQNTCGLSADVKNALFVS